MVLEVLSPGMKHAQQADVGSQVLRVACDFEQRGGTGTEEQIVEQLFILQHECRELMRQSKDEVEVGHGQQLGRARSQPSVASVPLTLGAVPVAAGVIGDGLVSAAGATVAMSAERRRAATHDRVHHLAVLRGKMRSMPSEEAAARYAKDVGHLKGGPAHRFARLLESFSSAEVETVSDSSGLATACR